MHDMEHPGSSVARQSVVGVLSELDSGIKGMSAGIRDCRFWRSSLSVNRLLRLEIAVVMGLWLVFVFTATGNSLFGTAPVAADIWLLGAGFAALLAVCEETRKYLVRRWVPAA